MMRIGSPFSIGLAVSCLKPPLPAIRGRCLAIMNIFFRTGEHPNLPFVAQGAEKGRSPELVGGGLLRSMGGWKNLKELRGSGEKVRADEQILGGSEFVERNIERSRRGLGAEVPTEAEGNRSAAIGWENRCSFRSGDRRPEIWKQSYQHFAGTCGSLLRATWERVSLGFPPSPLPKNSVSPRQPWAGQFCAGRNFWKKKI